MPYSIKHNPLPDFIELMLRGATTGTDLREATTKCISLGKQIGSTRFLVDATGASLAASMIDIYNLPADQYEKEDFDRQNRVAVILPVSAEARKAAEFYETVCRNRGWCVQVFLERQSAIHWLVR